jgi:hypothetical protein
MVISGLIRWPQAIAAVAGSAACDIGDPLIEKLGHIPQVRLCDLTRASTSYNGIPSTVRVRLSLQVVCAPQRGTLQGELYIFGYALNS